MEIDVKRQTCGNCRLSSEIAVFTVNISLSPFVHNVREVRKAGDGQIFCLLGADDAQELSAGHWCDHMITDEDVAEAAPRGDGSFSHVASERYFTELPKRADSEKVQFSLRKRMRDNQDTIKYICLSCTHGRHVTIEGHVTSGSCGKEGCSVTAALFTGKCQGYASKGKAAEAAARILTGVQENKGNEKAEEEKPLFLKDLKAMIREAKKGNQLCGTVMESFLSQLNKLTDAGREELFTSLGSTEKRGKDNAEILSEAQEEDNRILRGLNGEQLAAVERVTGAEKRAGLALAEQEIALLKGKLEREALAVKDYKSLVAGYADKADERREERVELKDRLDGKWRLLEVGEYGQDGDEAFLKNVIGVMVWIKLTTFIGKINKGTAPVRRKIII